MATSVARGAEQAQPRRLPTKPSGIERKALSILCGHMGARGARAEARTSRHNIEAQRPQEQRAEDPAIRMMAMQRRKIVALPPGVTRSAILGTMVR